MAARTNGRIADSSPNTGTYVCLLSGFDVTHEGERLLFPASAARLIGYLALQPRPVSRATVAGVLWPDTTQERAQASLRSALWRARRVLAEAISSENSSLTLAEQVSVDVDSIVGIKAQLEAGLEPDQDWALPISWFSRELLPDWPEDWVAFERERIRLTALQALEGLAAWHRESENFTAAIDCAMAAVRLEPLRESAYRELVAAHIAKGNLAEAVRHYQMFSDLLRTELGVGPTKLMADLLESVGLLNSVRVA